MKKVIAFIDYIFLLRPSIQAALWTFLFAGSYLYLKNAEPASPFCYGVTSKMALALLGYSLVMGSVYVLNQIRDIDTDRINKKLFLLSERIIPLKRAYIFALVCAATGFSVFLFFGKFNINTVLLIVVSFIMGLLYTIKPFEFKRRCCLDMILNSLGYGMVAPLIGYEAAGGALNSAALIATFPYVFSMAAVFINTTLMDYEGDKAVGAKTTGVVLGFKKSMILSTILMLCSAVLGLILKDYIVSACAFYSSVFFAYALLKQKKRILDLSVKLTSPVMTLAFGILFPLFLVLSAFVLLSIFFYYRYRFNLKVV
ncbi:MAG: UbiA prenyltransferase family protein [bacterium]|nr:UbiA prenyltransferase family protein [bacterium]